MRLPPVAVAVLSLTPLLVVRAAGQICAGAATFKGAPLQFAGTAESGDHAHAFGAGFAFGSATAFAGVGVGTIHFDDLNASTTSVSAGAGYQLPLDHRGGVQLCPSVAVAHEFGLSSSFGGQADYSETDVGVGLALGVVAMESDAVRLIPTFGLDLDYAHQSLSNNVGASTTASHGFGVFQLGLGLVYNKTLTFLPRVSVPIGLANSSAAFGLTFAVNFGH